MENKPPNILIIHSDEHRFDCLGCSGNEKLKTPNIDGLAADGVVYTNCFSTFPLCTPARYSLITGLYAHQHLGLNNQSTLPAGIFTFPKMLGDSGYKTKCVGKMHFTPTYLDVGFQDMILSEQDGPGRYDDDYHRYLKDKGLSDCIDLRDQSLEFRLKASQEYHESFGARPSDLNEENYSTTWIGDRACESLQQWNEGENLLMVGFIKPHHPHDAPPPWSEMYNPEKLSLLPGWTEKCLDLDIKFNKGFADYSKLTEPQMKKVLAQYYAAISEIDFQVGRMIKILKEKGIYDNTLIIYTSDHGDYMSFHHLILKGNYMYDPLIKVPLVVKYPNSEYKGTIESKLVSIIDITGTIILNSGNMIPQEMWGLIKPVDEDDLREVVFAEDNGRYMVRTKNRKLLLVREKKSQFFNLDLDPYELTNLFDDPNYQKDIQKLKEMLLNWLAFDSKGIFHSNKHAKIISADHVPDPNDNHNKEIYEYFQGKMDEFFKKQN